MKISENKILTTQQAITLSEKLRNEGKKIVLAGGCFDILHAGHISFLKRAKEQGGTLFILLESDDAIKKTKGDNRPINTQADRAEMLASLLMTDYIVLLEGTLTNDDYDKLILAIKPDIIATTKADPYRIHKERQAKLVRAKVVDVTKMLRTKSTTKISDLLQKEL